MTEDGIPRNQIVHRGFTFGQLQRAFEAVHDPDDWKAPIFAAMPGEAVMPTVAAIEFYTATAPQVSLDVSTMTYFVESEGYRAGPAGP